MYLVKTEIENQEFNGLKVQKITTDPSLDILSITLEENSIFPEHTSPRNATLIVLKGEINFHINEMEYIISKQNHFQFEKEVKHWVRANKDSKFLIIR
jgi:quercetin dioxygenase-like cupin family protein